MIELMRLVRDAFCAGSLAGCFCAAVLVARGPLVGVDVEADAVGRLLAVDEGADLAVDAAGRAATPGVRVYEGEPDAAALELRSE